MRRRTVLAGAVLATTLTATGCFGQAGDGAEEGPPILSDVRLVSFDACDDLLGWVKDAALERVGPYGLDGGSGVYPMDGGRSSAEMAPQPAMAAPATTVMSDLDSTAGKADEVTGAVVPTDSVSGTNTVEAGVDEPDLLKTDGERIVALARGRLQILAPGDGTPTLLGSLDLPVDSPAQQLLLEGDRVLLIGSAYGVRPLARTPGIAPGEPAPGGGVPKAVLREVDISDPAAPRITATLEVEGDLVDTRAVDGVARVVLRSQPAQLDFVYPSGPGSEETAAEFNRQVIAESTIEQWLPSYALESGGQQSTGAAVECNQVHHPAIFSGFSLLSVLTVDLSEGLSPGAGAGVMADGQRVYASPANLYVALDHYPEGPAASEDVTADAVARPVPSAPPESATLIHKFTITGAEPAVYTASGTAPGLLLNDYAMSEYEGVLRVATTLGAGWWGGGDEAPASESFVTTLGQQGDQLAQLGQVGGLGLGEQIFGVRFVGPVGYVVTFRQTDPLYTLDLADPAAPTVQGELKILGYSAYLHPLGDGLLLGVGQDATEEGMRTGAQVSLFDVSDLANPQRLSQLAVPDGWTSAESDRHAFLWWAPAGLAVLPLDVNAYNADGSTLDAFSGVLGVNVDAGQLSERGRISHPATEPECTIVPEPRMTPSGGAVSEKTTTGAASEPDADAASTVAPMPPMTTIAPAPDSSSSAPAPSSSSSEPGWSPWCQPFAPQITRSLVIGDVLYTFSDAGLHASDLATLGPVGWLAFS